MSVDLSQFRLKAVALTAQPDGGALRERVRRGVFLRFASQSRSYTSQLTVGAGVKPASTSRHKSGASNAVTAACNFRFPDLGGNPVGTLDEGEGHSCPGFRMREILQGEFLEERG
ncbi:hypothetical protein, partial [Accumulibacter sp.]|uniref:hypothetical protein n=1 Tax=Accumulibacter sp. TaxID=2053492 RepID=UPI00260C9572